MTVVGGTPGGGVPTQWGVPAGDQLFFLISCHFKILRIMVSVPREILDPRLFQEIKHLIPSRFTYSMIPLNKNFYSLPLLANGVI